jgi:hypothetical protein
MSDYNMSLDYHLSQLQQVAADLRAERNLATPPAHRSLTWFRTAIAEVTRRVRSTLVVSQTRPSVQAR